MVPKKDVDVSHSQVQWEEPITQLGSETTLKGTIKAGKKEYTVSITVGKELGKDIEKIKNDLKAEQLIALSGNKIGASMDIIKSGDFGEASICNLGNHKTKTIKDIRSSIGKLKDEEKKKELIELCNNAEKILEIFNKYIKKEEVSVSVSSKDKKDESVEVKVEEETGLDKEWKKEEQLTEKAGFFKRIANRIFNLFRRNKNRKPNAGTTSKQVRRLRGRVQSPFVKAWQFIKTKIFGRRLQSQDIKTNIRKEKTE